MKIGVISDTHLKGSDSFLEKVAERHFSDVDLILHAGDIISLDVLNAFKGKKLIAVAGNSDLPGVRETLPERSIIRANHFKIGLTHGWGFPLGMGSRVGTLFEGVDCVVFGHSHRATIFRRKGILYFNPGALSPGIASLWRRSIGILTVEKEIRGEIIKL